jgi:hypothetical protein
MTDYIKRTDAVKIAEKYGLANGSVLGRHTGLADCIARDISDLPAADVAEVVLCKNCKWFADNNGGEWYGCKMFHVVRITPEDTPKPDDFCSYGERREGGNGDEAD